MGNKICNALMQKKLQKYTGVHPEDIQRLCNFFSAKWLHGLYRMIHDIYKSQIASYFNDLFNYKRLVYRYGLHNSCFAM